MNINPFIFPDSEVLNYPELYIRGAGYIYNDKNKEIFIKSGGRIQTDTYYNALSIEKWRYYTTLKNVFLRLKCTGSFVLQIMNSCLVFDKVVTKILKVYTFENIEEKYIEVDISDFQDIEGIIYFKIEALTDVSILGGGYFTNSEETKKSILGIVICTYKREKYIQKFINNFKKYNKKKQLKIFIIDNGNTLGDLITESNVKILPNRNYGGAGGFSRGLLEIKNDNDNTNNKEHIDYVILMDDDIYIDFAIFDKLLPFLSLRKECFKNYFLAGTMCSLDDKKIQYERYAKWTGNGFIQMSPNFNLEEKKCILKNEKIEHMEYSSAGWWFSCFHTDMITPNNFPFPCFFRGDDMEYTIRNCSNIMTLNGINVWHEPFYKKYSITSEDYYLIRNTLVINTLYCNWTNATSNTIYLFKKFAKSIIKYDYSSAELIIKALIDYEKGPEFFKKTNPEQLNIEISKFNHRLEHMNTLLSEFVADHLVNSVVSENDKNKLHKMFRFLSFNGNLLPSFLYREWAVSFIGYGARAINFYRTKRVLNYDPFSQKGYYTSRNFRKAVFLTLRFVKELIRYRIAYSSIQKDYQCNFRYLQTEKFWKSYLGLDKDGHSSS